MLLKDLKKIYHMCDARIYIDGDLYDTNDFALDTFNEYDVLRIEPGCEASGKLEISKGITVEPYLEIHLNNKTTETYEVETGRINEEGVEFGFKFVSFDTYEAAKKHYDNYEISDPKYNYKVIYKLTLYNGEELYRDIMEKD